MDTDWLKQKLTVAQAESKHMVSDPRLGPTPVPFGFCHAKWQNLLSKMQDGDELWEFSSSDHSWQHLAGRAGLALVRNGQIIHSIVTAMN